MITSPIRVLVLGIISENALNQISGRCELHYLPHDQPAPGQLTPAQVIIARSHVRIDEQLLRHTPELELVIRAGAGLDNVDIAALERRGVRLHLLGAQASANSVAELALAQTLYLLRRIGIAHGGLSKGKWLKRSLMGEELYHRRVAVWGYGEVGRSAAELFDRLGTVVRVHNRSGHTGKFEHEPSLEALSEWADVHVLALPDTEETTGLLSAKLLEIMAPRTPVIVNVGRSSVADFSALLFALESGAIAGLGIDPLDEDDVGLVQKLALRTDLNAVFTPHIGSTTSAAIARMGGDIVTAVFSYLESRSA